MKPQQKIKPSIALIKQLRSVTNAPIGDCREALASVLTVDDDVDIDATLQAAKGWLREKGRLRAASKAGRIAREGIIGVHIHQNRKTAIVMELNCETDFVAKSDPFQKVCLEILDSAFPLVSESDRTGLFPIAAKDISDSSMIESITQLSGQVGEKIELRRLIGAKLNEENSSIECYMHNKVCSDISDRKKSIHLTSLGRIASIVCMQSETEEAKNAEVGNLIAMHIVAESPTHVSRDSIPTKELQNMKDAYQQEANQYGKKKPAHIMKKIINGKLNKFYKQNLLLEQEFSVVGDADGAITVQRYCDKAHTYPTDFLRVQVGEE